MQLRTLQVVILASALTISMSIALAIAQEPAKQDIKAADTDTKNATEDVGKGVATGSKKVYKKTASGTKTVGKDIGHGSKVAAEGTAHGTEKLGDNIAGKPTQQ